MYQPARTKFRKAHKGRIHGKASRCDKLNFGEYGLKLHDRQTDLAGVERCLVFGRLPPLELGCKKRLGKVCRKS